VQGLKRETVKGLGAGETRVVKLPLGELRSGPIYRMGAPYYAVEMEFKRGGELDRAYVTTHVPAAASSANEPVCLRDAAQMAGPFDDEKAFLGKLEGMSVAGAAMDNFGEAANLQWFTASPQDRERYGVERLTLYHDTKAWKAALGGYSLKPRNFLAAMDFTLSDAASITLTSGIKPSHIFLNGKELKGSQLRGAAGANRCILVLPTKDDRGSFAAYPAFLRLEPASGKLSYTLVPAKP
jgi:hypothetical protein